MVQRMSKNNLICEKDPRGITVTLSQKQYQEHIINASGHAIMAQNIEAIKGAVKQPDMIYESTNSGPSEYREVYIKYHCCATYEPEMCTKVVTAPGGGYAEVVTAFPANATKATQGTKGDALYVAESGVQL